MTTAELSAIAVIPAAGIGQRMGSDLPKQYLECNGRPLISYPLELFQACQWISVVYVSLAENDNYWAKLVDGKYSKVVTVEGGDTRAKSVANGLAKAQDDYPESTWVLVHDAARPCLFKQDMAILYDEMSNPDCDGFIFADKVNDTVKQVGESGSIEQTVDRSKLWRAQTPQVFKLGELAKALADLDLADITDEASAMEQTGASIKVVQGNPRNIKVTQPDDLAMAELYLSNWLID